MALLLTVYLGSSPVYAIYHVILSQLLNVSEPVFSSEKWDNSGLKMQSSMSGIQ